MGTISRGGYCGECGPLIHIQNNEDLHYHRGYYFQRWRRAHAAAAGAVLLDDLPAHVRDLLLEHLKE